MSFAIVCHGCGSNLSIPDGYSRNKIQCTECGVLCQVPARPAPEKPKEKKQPVEDASALEVDKQPAAPVRSVRAPVTTIVKEPVPAAEGVATCPHCGELVRAPDRKRKRVGKCPACGVAWPAPAARPKPPPRPVPPPPDEFAGSTPDDDPDSGNPYRTADAGSRRCPGCTAQLGPAVVLCVRCGFDLREGRKTSKEYQPFAREWDSGMSLRTRFLLFLLCQLGALAIIAFASTTVEDSLLGEVVTFGFSWVVFTGMTGFILGTFDHIGLKRYKSGRVDLTKAWRVCFYPMPLQKIDVRDYSGVITAARSHGDWLAWLIFIVLLTGGCFPALVYWYCVIYKTEYLVALTNAHETAEIYVYRGWSAEQMDEIKQMLRDAMTQ